MAYRRKQGVQRSATFEDPRRSPAAAAPSPGEPDPASSLAAQAIRASAAHRDSSLSSAYGDSAYRQRASSSPPREPITYEYTSMQNLNESKYGFWGVLARKAKALLEDDNDSQQSDLRKNRHQMFDTSTDGECRQSYRSPETFWKSENHTFHKGSESITSSLNHIGGTIRNALEEGLKNVEHKTADIIQETRKLQIRKKASGSNPQDRATDSYSLTDQETQLKASRDVANAMAAKAKLLLRELKTVKADLAFAKERSKQLEEENKILRESQEKGDIAEDDDLIRLQLETLLAEKARLTHENSVYARENRFLREIVEYHQLTMQDVVYVDEGIEEVTEVYPFPYLSSSLTIPKSSSAIPPSSSPTPSPSPSTTPIWASTPRSSCSITMPEACPIFPSPPTLVAQITTINVPPGNPNTSSVRLFGDGLKRQNSTGHS